MDYSLPLVTRQISADLARLTLQGGAELGLSLDEVVLTAQVPVLRVDFRELNLKENILSHVKFLRLFLDLKNSYARFKRYTYEAAREGLYQEWIQNIGDGLKREILHDLKIVERIDDSGRVFLKENLVKAYLSMQFEDLKYGQTLYPVAPKK